MEVKDERRALTAREREVMTLISRGMSNKEVAKTLGLQPGTIKVHVHNIHEKLGSRNRVMAVMLTWERDQDPAP
jgi:DNA-binding NarL/FixJ family response regulator